MKLDFLGYFGKKIRRKKKKKKNQGALHSSAPAFQVSAYVNMASHFFSCVAPCVLHWSSRKV